MMIGTGSVHGQTSALLEEEQQLRKEMDEWMKPYRRERITDLEEWIGVMEKPEDSLWKHSVYQHMDSFYLRHKQQYHRLRKADLTRYQPAPALLPGYEQVPDFYITDDQRDTPLKDELHRMQSFTNFRTLDLADSRLVSGVIFGYVLQFLKAEMNLTLQQVLNQRMYDDLYFADFLQGDHWQITVINRLYVLKFIWNIADNHISMPQLWVYKGKRQPPGWLHDQFPKSRTAIQELDRAVSAFRWSLYDEPDSEVLDFNRMVTAVPDKLVGYYQSHRQEYIRLRNEELAGYPPLDTAYANTFEHDNTELKEFFLSKLNDGGVYRLSDFVVYGERGVSYTLYNIFYTIILHTERGTAYALASWIAGDDIFTGRIREDLWKIQYFYNNFAISFHWNLATDEISDFTVKTRENVTIDRPVGDPTEIN